MRGLVCLMALVLGGCAYTIQLRSDIPGAQMEGLSDVPTRLPTQVKVPWGPWVRRRITLTAPNYRPQKIDLGHRTARAGDLSYVSFLEPWRPRTQVLDVVLVREHGLSGEWTSAELGVSP